MTIGEKYAKVLSLRNKKSYKAEDEMGFGRNTLSNAIKANRMLSEEYHKKFMSHFRVNEAWWEREDGEVFSGNDTFTGNSGISLADAIRSVVEDGTEYLVVPRLVLEGKYRLVPIEQIEKDQRELDDRSRQIQGLHEIIREITARPINIQFPKVEKA